MLISFTVKNWMCFKEETTLYMKKTRERQHSDRIPRSDANDISILPVGAIYGANASGKSSLFEAIRFARKFVILPLPKPETKIPIKPFKLDDDSRNNPSTFEFDVLINEKRYVYMFSVTKEEVLEEKLVEVRKSGSEKVLFHRDKGNDDPRLEKSIKGRNRMQYVFENTRKNILFLSKTVDDNFDDFKFFFEWVNKNLVLIRPKSSFNLKQLPNDQASNLLTAMSPKLKSADFGISSVTMESRDVSHGLIKQILSDYEDESFTRFVINDLSRSIVFYHKGEMGVDYPLQINDESDGTIRFMDLLPPIIGIEPFAKAQTIFIDEIDRSLHTLLTRKLIQSFLEGCNKDSRDQLIFTTHDTLLMDQDILRRDEIHLVEKDEYGSSTLFSISDFKGIRFDMDIMRNYLFSKFGGIPNIKNRDEE